MSDNNKNPQEMSSSDDEKHLNEPESERIPDDTSDENVKNKKNITAEDSLNLHEPGNISSKEEPDLTEDDSIEKINIKKNITEDVVQNASQPDNISLKEESNLPEDTPDNISTAKKEKPEEDSQNAHESEKIPLTEESKIKDKPKSRKAKTSNYQISLIDENLLKVSINTRQSVKIISKVKDPKTSAETQSNEINLYPKFNLNEQEINVSITISDEEKENIKTEETGIEQSTAAEENKKSNYQINLVNENHLSIKIETPKGILIDSVSKEKFTLKETQTNKIYLQPKPNLENQLVEITIQIEHSEEETDLSKEFGVKLIPNPEVVDLIQTAVYPDTGYIEQGFDVTGGYINPFDALRKLIQRNITIGIIAAVALHLLAAGIIYFTIGKKPKNQTPEELSRLIVIQDLPDPKIKLQDVEDPNKPKVLELPEDETKSVPKREIKPQRTVKPPIVKRPDMGEDKNRDSTLQSNLTRELDSLRKLVERIDSLSDSTKADSLKLSFEIPDSLRNNFNEHDIGLAMYFPKSWKLTDQREINKNEKDFKGVLLTDTTAEQPGTMTMFIYLDNENKDFNAEDFKTEFKLNDSTITAFSKEPKTIAGFTEYKFYLFNKLGTEKLSIGASVRKQFFDQYKNEIEAVVRSISIKRKEDLNKTGETNKSQ